MIFARSDFSQFCLLVSCLVGLFAALPATVNGHVYEDGFVERSLTVTIRDGVGYGEYQIGLNASTADQILKLAEQLNEKNALDKWKQEHSATVEQHSHSKTPRPLLPTAGLKGSEPTQSNEPNQSNEAVKSGAIKSKKEPTTVPNFKASSEPAAAVQNLTTVGAGEHLTDLATIKRFGGLRQQWFADHLKLFVDGEAVEFSELSVEPASRHPYSILVKFQFLLDGQDGEIREKAPPNSSVKKMPSVEPHKELPANKVVDFEVADELFPGYSGAVRYALRARGSTMLLQSNVAPVLVRADRVEINKQAAAKAKSLPAIKAKLTLSGR